MINLDFEQIKIDEGFRATPYRCTADKLTIGYGINLDAGITEQEAATILRMRLHSLAGELIRQLPWLSSKPDECLNVLCNMAYNIGINGLLKFTKTLKAMEHDAWLIAAMEMRDSKWFNQVPNRAERLAKRIEALENAG